MKPVIMLVAAALAVGSFGFGASAREERVVVRYGELDLSKPAGRDVLMTRLRVAAGRVCGREPHQLAIRHKEAHADCIQDAMERALSQLPADVAMQIHGKALREAGLR